MKKTLDITVESSAGKCDPVHEKRREPRRPAYGSVEVKWSDPATTEVRGTLVDISDNGFRMAHSYIAIEAGQIVEFVHREARGRARVVWTRVLAQEGAHRRVESGFLLLEGPLGGS